MKNSQSMVASVILAPVTAATTARTGALDCQNADYATIYLPIGAQANTNATAVAFNLKESDTNVAINYATFNASYSSTVTNTAGVVVALNVDLKGRKRYLQVSITPDTTTNGAVITSAIGTLRKDLQGANSANADVVVVG